MASNSKSYPHRKVAILALLFLVILIAVYRGFVPSKVLRHRQPQQELPTPLELVVGPTQPPPSNQLSKQEDVAKDRIKVGKEEEVGQTTQTQNPPATSHWRLYGGRSSANNDGMTHRKEHGGEVNNLLFSYSSTDKNVRKVVAGLQSHPISCSRHSLEYQLSLSKKLSKFMQALGKYTSFHAENRGNSSSLKVAWFCGTSLCGGLADRLRGLTYIFILSVISQRLLLVDWFDSRVQYKTFLEPNLIDWRLTSKEKETVLHKQSNFEKVTDKNSALYLPIYAAAGTNAGGPDEKYKKMLQVIVGSHPLVAIRTNLLPSGLLYGRVPKSVQWIKEGLASLGLDQLTRFEFDQLMGVAFRYLFKFSSEIVKEMAAARSTLGLAGGLSYVGVHIRTGFIGSKTEVQPHHYKLSQNPKQWTLAFKCALKVFDNQEMVPIFLATDSNTVKDIALREYGDRVRSLNDTVVHVDNFRPPPGKVTKVVKEGVMSVWVELVMLAEAHTVVMGKSGYSFLGQSLCLMPQTRVLNGDDCKPVKLVE